MLCATYENLLYLNRQEYKHEEKEECKKALQQIVDTRYVEALEQEGIHAILKYGIACYKKKCKVMVQTEEEIL